MGGCFESAKVSISGYSTPGNDLSHVNKECGSRAHALYTYVITINTNS